MARAILIAGDDESRFRNDVDAMTGYLVRIGISDVEILPAYEMRLYGLEDELSLGIARRSQERLLLLYAGHGVRGAWSVARGERRLPYRHLATLLARRPGQVLFLNSCCYAASVITPLEMLGVSPRRLSLIASSPADKVCYNGTVGRVVDSWEKGEPYQARKDDGRTEYIGAIGAVRPTVSTTIDAHGRTIDVIDLRNRDPWWFRFRNRFAVAWRRRFPLVEPWRAVDERRWGIVLDHAFMRE